ncbi:MAG: hypothetical protein IJX77_09580 [Ruminococcus sp.]|nr:hypothetical protein [Ruminococcus sp.]
MLKIRNEVDNMFGFQQYMYDVMLAVRAPDYLTYVGQLLQRKHYGKMRKYRSRN